MGRPNPTGRGGRASPRNGSRRYHDRVARRYDAIYDDPYWHFHDELTWRLIKPYLPRDLAVPCADLGCGTGKWGLRLLKSGFAVTFVDHAAAMIEQVRAKLDSMGARQKKATLAVGDIIGLPMLEGDQFGLVVAMGDPLSICSDPQAAANEMHRLARPGGIVIATADNKLAALDHYAAREGLDGLEQFIQSGRTHWLTADQREQFELTTFTPASLGRLFERAGFEVLSLIGKPVLPLRANKPLLDEPDAVRRLVKMEMELSKDPAAAARSAHLQITARKKPA